MSLEIISTKESLVEKAGEILLSAGSLADNIAVFPGKRPGHFLRKYLAEKRGSALRAPQVLSMDGFIDLAAEALGVKGNEASALDLAEMLYSRLKKELCRVIARDPKELTLESFLPWALKLIGDFEELKIELKTRKELSGYDAVLPEDLRSASFIKKLESFSRLYGDFYEELEKENLLTRSMKYARVAADIEAFDHKRYENMIFAGFFALTGSEKVILKHLCGRGARILLEAGPGLEEQFQFLEPAAQISAAARRPGSAQAEGDDRKTALHFYKASDAHGEVFKLAQLMRAQGHKSQLTGNRSGVLNPQTLPAGLPDGLSSSPLDNDVIVLPEAKTLFPLIENVLPEAENYNISMGYPLTATPVYALLDALGDLLDKKGPAGYFAPNYLKFVSHPYIKNIYFRAAARRRDGAAGMGHKSAEPGRVIFQTIEEHLSGRMNKYITLAEIGEDAELAVKAASKLKDYGEDLVPGDIKAHIIAAHGNLIVPFEDIKDISDFAGKLLDLISYVSENSTAPLHPYWAPFVEKTMELLIEIKNSRLAGKSFEGAAGYFKFLKTFWPAVRRRAPQKSYQVSRGR